MKLPKLEKPDKYIGLYVLDFGESASVGFTAEEVAELLESEQYKSCKVYKIYKAYPDGRIEITGVNSEIFQLEAGMFFYSTKSDTAEKDFKQLVDLAIQNSLPCRAKVHLAKYSDSQFAVALIYPAEYDQEISRWLLQGKYRTSGQAEGGIKAVQRYYDSSVEILQRHQFFKDSEQMNRTGEELLASVKTAIQR